MEKLGRRWGADPKEWYASYTDGGTAISEGALVSLNAVLSRLTYDDPLRPPSLIGKNYFTLMCKVVGCPSRSIEFKLDPEETVQHFKQILPNGYQALFSLRIGHP